MDKDYIIFQEDGLFGAKDQMGNVVIKPQYKEMNPFSCGLSLVRDDKFRYTYINPQNKTLFPFGLYAWCDNVFCCGFARVMRYNKQDEKKWGIINALGEVVLPMKYDNIWTLNENYIHSIKVAIDGKEHTIDASLLVKDNSLSGLVYIKTYTVEDFKKEFGLDRIEVKIDLKTGRLFFPFRTAYGEVAIGNTIPKKDIVVSIVANAQGNIFPLLHHGKDTGVSSLKKSFCDILIKERIGRREESFRWEDDEPWEDYADYSGWSREDLESGLADAFEGDYDEYKSR